MVRDYLSQRGEAGRLVKGGLADDEAGAFALMESLEEQREQSDIMIFYEDYRLVKQTFPGIIDEKHYRSDIRSAWTKSGFLGKIKGKDSGSHERSLALGKITEMKKSRLTAAINNFGYEGKDGIFLSPWSAEKVHKKGMKTYDERNNLYRIEFKPVDGDYIVGMFSAWSMHKVNDHASLTLYIPKSQVMEM